MSGHLYTVSRDHGNDNDDDDYDHDDGGGGGDVGEDKKMSPLIRSEGASIRFIINFLSSSHLWTYIKLFHGG